MRFATTLIIALFAVGLFSSSTVEDQKINFIHDLDKAIEMAEETGKPIFLDAYASWCGPCKMLDRYTFSDKDVAAYYNENFINVKIDFDKNHALKRKYNVRAYPTLLFLKSDGSVQKKSVGFLEADDFLALGKKVIK